MDPLRQAADPQQRAAGRGAQQQPQPQPVEGRRHSSETGGGAPVLDPTAGPIAIAVYFFSQFFLVMMLGNSLEPLVRFAALLVVVAGAASGVWLLMGPLGLGITAGAGVLGAGVHSRRGDGVGGGNGGSGRNN